jgi:hypothetical protein
VGVAWVVGVYKNLLERSQGPGPMSQHPPTQVFNLPHLYPPPYPPTPSPFFNIPIPHLSNNLGIVVIVMTKNHLKALQTLEDNKPIWSVFDSWFDTPREKTTISIYTVDQNSQDVKN